MHWERRKIVNFIHIVLGVVEDSSPVLSADLVQFLPQLLNLQLVQVQTSVHCKDKAVSMVETVVMDNVREGKKLIAFVCLRYSSSIDVCSILESVIN